MPLSREKIQRRALKAGVKASKKRHHLVSSEELLSLRVQTMPALLRVLLVVSGILFIVLAWHGWPPGSNALQGLEVIGGIFSILFGAFGIRRTLAHVLDSVNALDLADVVLELVAEVVSNIDL
jgi:hypothetical protein